MERWSSNVEDLTLRISASFPQDSCTLEAVEEDIGLIDLGSGSTTAANSVQRLDAPPSGRLSPAAAPRSASGGHFRTSTIRDRQQRPNPSGRDPVSLACYYASTVPALAAPYTRRHWPCFSLPHGHVLDCPIGWHARTVRME